MKKLYTSPKADMIEFDAKDVITTSGVVVDTKFDASSVEDDYKVMDGSDWTDFL